jgi:hypothetical protein
VSDSIEAFSQGVAAKFGGLSEFNRHFFVKAVFRHALNGLVIAIFMLMMLCLRTSWFNPMALSLILAVPFCAFLTAGGALHSPISVRLLVAYGKAVIVPSILTLILLATFLLSRRCVQQSRLSDRIGRSRMMGWVFCSAIAAVYFSASVYGWNDLRHFHTTWNTATQSWKHRLEAWEKPGKGQEKGTFWLCRKPPMLSKHPYIRAA